jgi:uncharacterized protein (TIGR03000 family)
MLVPSERGDDLQPQLPQWCYSPGGHRFVVMGGIVMALRARALRLVLLVIAICLLAVPGLLAQDGRGYRIPEKFSQPPWLNSGYRGYNEPPRTPPPSASVTTPQRYTLRVTVLSVKNEEDPNAALMMAHLPEDALIWFQDTPTRQTGSLRHFLSPALTPGRKYIYTVRVQWHEGGKWVSQVHSFPIRAGEMHCIDIVPADSAAVHQDVAANLAKLDPQDRKAAEEQRFCAIQEGIRLGSMGAPFKVTLQGQPVFLCCEGCAEKARSSPQLTLERVKNLKAKNAATDSP